MTITGSSLTTWLPADFKPGENEVIIGRGRKILQHSGNVKLRTLVQLKAKDYSESGDKTHKSFIISDIGIRIKRESSHGGFVKKDNQSGKWYVVSDSCVRATIAQSFRDRLSPSYRSSKFSKQRRRWCEKSTSNTKQGVPTVTSVCPTDTNSISGSDRSSWKPLGETFSSFQQPLTMMNLQRTVVLPEASPPQLPLPTVASVLSSSGSFPSVAEKTSDILKRCMDVLDDDHWISYTDDPFEPNPIAERQATQDNNQLVSSLAMEGSEWWV